MNCVWACRLACIGFGVLFQMNASSAVLNGEPSGGLTLAQAIAVTMARNPDLAVSDFEPAAGDARKVQAGLRPNPDLALELEDLAGSGAIRGAGVLQSTLRLSQVIELGAKRERRSDVAGFDRELIGVDRRARELDVLAEVTRRFVDVIAAQELLSLDLESAELAQRTAKEISARVSAARSPQAELSRARIAVLRARAQFRQAQSVLTSARRALCALWGSAEARFDAAQGNFYSLPALDSFEILKVRLTANPDLTRFVTESRLRDAQWRLAQSRARPNLTLNVGVRRYEASNDMGLVAGFSMSLPVSDRNQGAIAEGAVRRQQTRVEEKATRNRIEATLFGLYQEVLASREELKTLREEAIPLAAAALEQTQSGYERGRFSYLELATAQQDLLGLRAVVITLAGTSHRLTAEIERLTSEPLVDSSNDRNAFP